MKKSPFKSWQVLEEMQRETEDVLRSQADGLAMQMATIHYLKAERRMKVLETSKAVLTLQNLLIQQLRERKKLEKQVMAQSIKSHCLVGALLCLVAFEPKMFMFPYQI